MNLQHLVVLSIQISIVCTVFGYGLKTTVPDLLYVVQHPGLLARSLISVFVIMPVVAIALTRLFDIKDVVEISLVALAISPVPPLLPMKEAKAGGRSSYGLGLLALLALLSIVTIPLAIAVISTPAERSRWAGPPSSAWR